MHTKCFLAAMLFSVSMIICSGQARAVSICVDAGHGGEDTGALGCSLVEKEINLGVALKLEPLLKAAGFTVFMTRTDDSTVELASRGAYANSKGADAFASIHTNSFSSVSTGIETYCFTGCTTAKGKNYQQASNIQKEMLGVWKLDSRGVKENNYAVLRQTNMPATLTELGFINNCDKDAVYLKSDSHRQAAAEAHCRALVDKWGGDRSKCTGSAPAETGKVTGGTFLGTIGGEWLGGVTVQIGNQSIVSSVTKSNWEMTVPVGHYLLTASKTGYQSVTRDDCEDVKPGGISWCSVALTPASASGGGMGRAYGTVQNSMTGDVIPAMVTVNGSSQAYTGETDWSFELPGGTYQITASADGFVSKSVSCVVTANEEIDCSVVLEPMISTIVGTVVDAVQHNPVAADVTLGEETQHYDGTGKFEFRVPAGTYTLTAVADGYDAGMKNCIVDHGDTVSCDIELTPSTEVKYFLKGKLLNKTTQKPIIGTVTISDELVFHYMGKAFYQFYLPPGSYQVLGEAEGYELDTRLCILADRDETCNLLLTPLDGTLRGFVYQAGNKQSLIPATVYVADKVIPYSGKQTWSVSLPPGNYEVTAISQDGQNGKTSCKVDPGKTTFCNIAILAQNDTATGKVGTLTGTVTKRGTQMLIPASISIEGFGSIAYSGRSDLPWIYSSLPEGTYRVYATSNGFYENAITCRVFANSVTQCDIELTEIEDVQPVTPTEPSNPVDDPVIPVNPVDPWNPGTSVDPVNPGDYPANPTDPSNPTNPNSSDMHTVTFHNDDGCSATPQSQIPNVPFGIMTLCGACFLALYRRRGKGENK